MLVLEDIHWADPPTVQLLGWLVNKPRNWPLMLVCTCRIHGTEKNHPLRTLLADLHREPDVLRLDLIGLASDDIVELVAGMEETPAGAAGPDLAHTLESNTNGNPFFVTELVRDLTEKGALVTEAGELRLKEGFNATAQLPVSISETLERRLGRMDVDVRCWLGVASAVGDEFDADLVSEIAGAESPSVAVARAVGDGVLIENPDRPRRFRFAHTLMRRYLYAQLDPAKQTDLHRQIALAIERRPEQGEGQIAELATHWAETVNADLDTALRVLDACRRRRAREARPGRRAALVSERT